MIEASARCRFRMFTPIMFTPMETPMSKLIAGLASAAYFLLLSSSPALAADVLAVPDVSESEADPAAAEAQLGDDLDLFAVLDTFKDSESVEDFEQRLNDPDAGLVNIDLNGDEEVDFVGVFEEGEGDVHVLILRAFLGEDDSQDVASIELEKKGEDVTVQVVGDPALYGPDYIVEPDLGEAASLSTRSVLQAAHVSAPEPIAIASADASWWPTLAPADVDGAFDLAVVVVVRTWPAVHVIYGPGYVYYRSPYRYHSYPSYHRARRPVARSHYRHHTAHHRDRHRRTTHRSSTRASNVYQNNKTSSPHAQQRSATTNAGPSPTPASTQSKPSTAQNQPQGSGHKPSARPSGGAGHGGRGGAAGRRR